MLNRICFVFLCLFPCFAYAQNPTQVIKGTVIDKDTRQTLIGATVSILGSDPMIGTVTDIDGQFRLENIPVGRQVLQCAYLGYQTFVSDNIIVNSAKEVELNIELIEASVTTEEVVVTAFKHSNEPLNDLSMVSARSFSAEETQRYAASANDPSRMSMGFPGVQPSRDSRSDIVVRGNSGIGLLWRLEGIDIPNPNHFARRGSSGGGITVFSVSMLGNSDFSTGAFPAEYGNAFSGVFDIHFRKGNREKREYSFRAGMLGLDLATEGPIKKGRSSYLINYRYSTLGLLNQMGIYLVNPRADNIFQDLSFHLYFPSKNNKSTLTVWGIGGLSDEFERAVDELDNQSTYSEKLTRDFRSNMGALGLTHTQLLDEQSFIKTSLALMGQEIIFRNDTLNLERQTTRVNDENYINRRITLTSYYSRKFNSKLSLKSGFFLNAILYDLQRGRLASLDELPLLDNKGETFLLQPYAQFRWRPSEKWTVNFGAHAMHLTLNQTTSVEPRLGIQYKMTPQNSLSFGYGLHSRMVPLGSYFAQNSDGLQPNLELDLIKSHHLVLAFDQNIGKSLRIHAETYFQYLFDVPVGAAEGSTHSALNTIDGYAVETLVSEGEGENIGLDLSLEKYFGSGSFFILSGSIFNSRYTDVLGKFHNTRYNSNYSGTFIGGKEWTFKNNGVLQTGLKLLFNRGARITPLLSGVRGDGQNPPWDESRPFEERVAPYFRPDIRIAYRKDNRKSAWTLSLDVQNVINRQNEDAIDRTYDPDTGSWVSRNQSGLTPILSFQVDW